MNSENQPQNIRAGCDYNPVLKNLQCLILGPRDVVLNPWVPKLNIANWKDWKKHQRDFRVAYFPVVTAVEDLCRKVEHWTQLSDSNTLQEFLFRLYSGKLRYGPPMIQSKSDGAWSISEHLLERWDFTRYIHVWVLSIGCFSIMQMLSPDSTWSEKNKKSLNKNGNTFSCELLNRTGLGQCVMQASTKLCLAFFEFYTVLENKRFFQLDPVPQGNFIPSVTPSLFSI